MILAFHWAPVARRRSIERVGLNPGSLSRNRKWRPPFISFGTDPAWALASADSYHDITEPMDLWEVDLEVVDFYESFSHNPDPHAPIVEMRVYARIPARHCTRLATREPED